MATYPCTIEPHRYGGPQRSIYLSRLNGARPETRKFRLCPRHFGDLMLEIRARMTDVEENGQMSMVCDQCDAPRETTISARCFEGGDDGEAYATDLCADHAAALADRLLWSSGMAL
jgi:hypothetical protein